MLCQAHAPGCTRAPPAPARAQLLGQELPADAEQLEEFWARTDAAWAACAAAAAAGGGANVVVVAHAAVLSALVGKCLGLGPEALGMFRFETGGVSILEFPSVSRAAPAGAGEASASSSSSDSEQEERWDAGEGVARCLNYTAHLGRWAVPITRDDYQEVCGIEGCF